MKRATPNKKKKLTDARKPGVLITIMAIFVLLVACAIAMVGMFLRGESGIELEEPAQQFFISEKVDIPAGSRLMLGENGLIISGDEESTLAEKTPIYYSREKSFITACNMSWVDMTNGAEWLVPALNTVSLDETGTAWCGTGDSAVMLTGGFLTDENETVTFLSDTKIIIDGKSYSLSPFSFYSAADGVTRIYDYDTDTLTQFDTDELRGDTVAAFSGGSINLRSFIITRDDGSQKMLVAAPDVLISIFEK